MSTKDETTEAPLQPIYPNKLSNSTSSTIVDVPSSIFKSKIVDSGIREPTAPAEGTDESEDEWIDGNDYPQFVNHSETWKTITI